MVLTLAGPTPHVQGRLYPFKGGPPLAGTAAFGLTPGVPASTPSLCILQSVDKSSARKLSVAHLGSARTAEARTLSIDGAVDLAALGPNALLVLSAQSSSALIAATPFNFVSADAVGGLSIHRATDLGVSPMPGFTWQALGAHSGAGVFVAVRTSDDSYDIVLFSSRSDPPVLRNSATLRASVAEAVIGVAIADVYGDGAPHVVVTYADSTVDVLWLTEGADDLYRAASFRLDPAWGDAPAAAASPRVTPPPPPPARWISVAAGAWLGAAAAMPTCCRENRSSSASARPPTQRVASGPPQVLRRHRPSRRTCCSLGGRSTG